MEMNKTMANPRMEHEKKERAKATYKGKKDTNTKKKCIKKATKECVKKSRT